MEDGGALDGMCEKDEKLWLSVTTCWRIMMVCARCRAITLLAYNEIQASKVPRRFANDKLYRHVNKKLEKESKQEWRQP